MAGVDVRLVYCNCSCQLDGEEIVVTLEGGEELRADAVIYGIGICQTALGVEAGLDAGLCHAGE